MKRIPIHKDKKKTWAMALLEKCGATLRWGFRRGFRSVMSIFLETSMFFIKEKCFNNIYLYLNIKMSHPNVIKNIPINPPHIDIASSGR